MLLRVWWSSISPGKTPKNTDSSDVPDMAKRIEEERGSVVSGEEDAPQLEEVVEVEEIRAMPAGVRAALRSIDDWDLNVIFQRRALFEGTVPQCHESFVGRDRRGSGTQR